MNKLFIIFLQSFTNKIIRMVAESTDMSTKTNIEQINHRGNVN